MQCNAMLKQNKNTIDTSLRTFPLVRPQLSTTIPLSTETLDSTRIDLLPTTMSITMTTAIVIPLSSGVIIKRQLSHWWDIPEREKRQIIQSVVAVRARHWEHPTVRVTRVVHETCGRAEFLPVHDVDVIVVDEKI